MSLHSKLVALVRDREFEEIKVAQNQPNIFRALSAGNPPIFRVAEK
jgi:hypothetical protein